jgi:glutathione S-transferase
VLRLYDYAPSGNCYKVRLLLAELEIPYERVPVDIFAGETLTDEYATRNPARTTPVLEIAPGTYLPESNAILLHLAEGTDLLPSEPLERAQVHRWLFFEQAAVIPMIASPRFRLLTGRMDPDSDRGRRAPALAAGIVGILELHLREREFVVGAAFTVADIGLYGYVHVAHEAGVEMDRFPTVVAWLDRVSSRPRHVVDLAPYPPNARPGVSRSIHDLLEP